MQALVPTDVDVEDKLLGPFTLKQSIYLLIGGMAITIIYFIFGKGNLTLFMILAAPVVVLTGAFVFYKFNEQPFEKFIFILANFYTKPRQRFWKKEAQAPTLTIEKETERGKVPRGLREETKKRSMTDIDKLAYILDSRGWEKTDRK